MAKRRKVHTERSGKAAAPRPKRVDDDEVLGEELIRTAHEQRAGFVAGWQQFMKQLGIRAKPIGANKLREMAIREGINPEGNEFSQGIIATREE
jgi:hypothetical protein